MNKKYFCLGTDYCTSDVLGRLYESAKWCHENKYKPLPILIDESTFKCLHSHPQLRGRLGITKQFPPSIEVLGFIFQVDLELSQKCEYGVSVVCGDVTIQDALILNFKGV